MGRFTEKIIMALIAVFLLAYVGYQAYAALYGSIKTATAFEYTVSRTLPVEGIAIRPEVVIEGDFQGIENYIFEDGARVTVGESVAEFYESKKSDANLRRSRELEAEIGMLEEAQDASANNFSSAEILNRDIKEQIGYLTGASGQQRFDEVSEIRGKLTALINKKQIATGMTTGFEARISELRTEYDSIDRETVDDSVMRVRAPLSGYFCKIVDGYEEELSSDSVSDYSITDYLALIDGEAPAVTGRNVGKIVKTQNWLFAAAPPKASLEFVRPGQEVYLSFESVGRKISASVESVMQEKDNERAVIVLACNEVSGELIRLRKTDAVIRFSRYTGIRVDMADIRFQNEQRGVYVIDGNTVRFKLIDPIYEEQSFVLSRLIQPESDEEQYVRLFDQIITRGNDLYDGKVL